MDLRKEWKSLVLTMAAFLGLFFFPAGIMRFQGPVMEALQLARWYAREHVILCLVPAFFIAGAITVFVRQSSIIKYIGPKAPKALAYGVASVSGSVLAVCSCTILPLFAGIYRMGAGLGPATAFLYAGPAVNILAVILTARILGPELGIARAVGAVLFSVLIGLIMHKVFSGDEIHPPASDQVSDRAERPLGKTVIFMAVQVAILVFATWGGSAGGTGLWQVIYEAKWYLTAGFAVILAVLLISWFSVKVWKVLLTGTAVLAAVWWMGTGKGNFALTAAELCETCGFQLAFAVGIVGLAWTLSSTEGEAGDWMEATWGLTKQILPLLLLGVLAAGFFLGRPGYEGIIPSDWVSGALGGNSLRANLFASGAGALMYFATLTEVPIIQGLMGAGMGKGPALALLLAGPALSLPNMLVIRSVMGTKKTAAFVTLVVAMATASGMIFGSVV
jgi:uncharacterized membrane protein YraQ (UPF0718 family)